MEYTRKSKTTFNMAQSSGETDVFDCQVAACNRFFVEELPSVTELKPLDPKHEIPKNMKSFEGPIYDITGFDAHLVVSLLVSIVNNKEQFKTNKTFYLLLHNSHENQPNDEIEELFRLKASPTTDQPGNGIVFLRPRGRKTFKTSAKKYDELNGALKAHYEKKKKQPDTASFARDIKELFEDNAVVSNDFPQATIEVYLLLLFEIARRLVALEKPSEKKKQYDVLPIGSAIARFVKLLELGSKEICTFEDVFLPKGIFHCFTGKPQDRRKAIDNINKATLEIAKNKEETLSMETDNHFQELKEMFRAPALTLAEEFEALMKFKDSESSDSMKSSFDAESYTASDYSDTTSS